MKSKIEYAADIIESIDHRASACDGPVPSTRQEATKQELDDILRLTWEAKAEYAQLLSDVRTLQAVFDAEAAVIDARGGKQSDVSEKLADMYRSREKALASGALTRWRDK